MTIRPAMNAQASVERFQADCVPIGIALRPHMLVLVCELEDAAPRAQAEPNRFLSRFRAITSSLVRVLRMLEERSSCAYELDRILSSALTPPAMNSFPATFRASRRRSPSPPLPPSYSTSLPRLCSARVPVVFSVPVPSVGPSITRCRSITATCTSLPAMFPTPIRPYQL